MNVLVINAGSSSTKYQVIDTDTEECLLKGQINGRPEDNLSTLSANMDAIFRDYWIDAVGHRIVHGGLKYTKPTLLTDEVRTDLRKLIPFAPLHQPFGLLGVDLLAGMGITQVACFDTMFHATRPHINKFYPLPKHLAEGGVIRYGFHGLSYEYISSEMWKYFEADKVVVVHLGSGSSACAMYGGRSVDCTLGFSGLGGMMMGTRPGDLDPGVFLYLARRYSVDELETIFYRESGLKGICGKSDMKEVQADRSLLATDAILLYVDSVVKQIGAMVFALGGIEALVLTGGIGENSKDIQEAVFSRVGMVLPRLDEYHIIPTNEELMIARHVKALIAG